MLKILFYYGSCVAVANIQDRFSHSVHSHKWMAFCFRQSPFSAVETGAHRVVGCDFRHFPLSRGWLTVNIMHTYHVHAYVPQYRRV